VVLFLASTLAIQGVHQGHLRAADGTEMPGLRKPLSHWPLSLENWSGQETLPQDPATLRYFNEADDKLNRFFAKEGEGSSQRLECHVSMIHFKDGRDRRHHPGICYPVAGFTIDEAACQDFSFPDQAGPARRFCVVRQGRPYYVYYWHYTLVPPAVEGLSWFQRWHQEYGVRWPSLSLQVFTNAQSPEQLDQVDHFVRLVDRQVQEYLPSGSRRGSDTLPVRRLLSK
jgi:hypothetical protein